MDELLQRILADPDADAPRLVYADHLLERGDPRGELIQLQFARRAGTATRKQRERERALLHEHGWDWVGPIAVAASAAELERGFVERYVLRAPQLREMMHIVDDPTWATVRSIIIREAPGSSDLLDVLTASSMRSLREVTRVPLSVAASLCEHGLASYGRFGVDVRNSWGNLRSWAVADAVYEQQVPAVELVVAADARSQPAFLSRFCHDALEELVLDGPLEVAEPLLAVLDPLAVPRVVYGPRSGVRAIFSRGPDDRLTVMGSQMNALAGHRSFPSAYVLALLDELAPDRLSAWDLLEPEQDGWFVPVTGPTALRPTRAELEEIRRLLPTSCSFGP